jgi:hypothetical protein
MIQVFQIRTDPRAPRLRVDDAMPYAAAFARFDGDEKGHLSPRASFRVTAAEGAFDERQFHHLAPGVLAGPEEGLNGCEDMYWATGGNERLALVAGDRPFVAINPLYFLDAPADGSSPCLVDRFYGPIFRIAGRDPTELFCAAGLAVPGDEFKHVYDQHGFRGLTFEEIWRGHWTPSPACGRSPDARRGNRPTSPPFQTAQPQLPQPLPPL